jgi:hypothetical protein
MQTTLNSTRGLSHDPAEAKRQREAAQAVRAQALKEAQIRKCYEEHMPAQRRWLGAYKNGAISCPSILGVTP